jgi:hypothetical protein
LISRNVCGAAIKPGQTLPLSPLRLWRPTNEPSWRIRGFWRLSSWLRR